MMKDIRMEKINFHKKAGVNKEENLSFPFYKCSATIFQQLASRLLVWLT